MKSTQAGTASVHPPRATDPGPPDEQRTHKVDAIFGAAADAPREFRRLDQEQVDRVVDATLRAGSEAAAEPDVLTAVPLGSEITTLLRLGYVGDA